MPRTFIYCYRIKVFTTNDKENRVIPLNTVKFFTLFITTQMQHARSDHSKSKQRYKYQHAKPARNEHDIISYS